MHFDCHYSIVDLLYTLKAKKKHKIVQKNLFLQERIASGLMFSNVFSIIVSLSTVILKNRARSLQIK